MDNGAKHLQIVDENMKHINDVSILDMLDNVAWSLDTESCSKYPLPKNATTQEIKECGAKLYLIGAMGVDNKKAFYCENFTEMVENIETRFAPFILSNKMIRKPVKNKKTKEYPKEVFYNIPIGIHNLAWDIQFIIYELQQNLGYNYKTANLSKRGSNLAMKYEPEGRTYHIVENDGIYYGAEIIVPTNTFFSNRDGTKTNISIKLDLWDTYKVATMPLSVIPSIFKKGHIEEMFYKMKEEYDYKAFREDKHSPTPLERRYFYNDLYLLAVMYKEYYIDTLLKGVIPNKGCRTASSIAFKDLKETVFGGVGDVGGNKAFREYYGLDKKTSYEIERKIVERISYKGGYTSANHKYVNQLIEKKGSSIDINSSYPSVMNTELLPYGLPIKKTMGILPKVNKEKE
ncbi:MAG: DNA polymerase, partial [Coprobacillus sp.]